MNGPVTGPVTVHVDRDRCLGAGMCALTAPAVFDQDQEEGFVVLVDARPPRKQHAAVRLAAGVCPASAIAVTEHGPSTVA
ncbi:ferredoxin [Streptomyces sp. URMC 123]|uniref:ferredoxin n=1 Tax=Streptomyces sp. URMC 123 TaxID=3423403 RepID=UPI003F1D5674